jgi:branched-chain amino acid transport system substrate-binding protein
MEMVFANNIRKRSKLIASSVAASYLLLVSPGQDHSLQAAESKESPVLKIGFISSLTGRANEAGTELNRGLDLLLDQTHHTVAGRKVDLIVADDASDRETAIAQAHKLATEDKVNVLAGIILANVSLGVAPVAEKLGIPLVLPIPSADDLTQRKHYNWLVRCGGSASQAMHPFGEYAYKTLGYKRIVIVGMDYPFGWDVSGGFQQAFELAGGKVIQKIWIPFGTTDLSAYINQIRQDADAVFEATVLGTAEVFAKQYHQSGLKLPLLAPGTSFDDMALRHMGQEAVGAKSAWVYSPLLKSDANQKFVAAYKSKYHGASPSYYAEAGYTLGLWIHKAVEAIHGEADDKEKLLTALKQVQLTDAPRGPIKLDHYGTAIENVYVRQVEMLDGKLHNVVQMTFPNVSQSGSINESEFLKQPVYSRDFPTCQHCESNR